MKRQTDPPAVRGVARRHARRRTNLLLLSLFVDELLLLLEYLKPLLVGRALSQHIKLGLGELEGK